MNNKKASIDALLCLMFLIAFFVLLVIHLFVSDRPGYSNNEDLNGISVFRDGLGVRNQSYK